MALEVEFTSHAEKKLVSIAEYLEAEWSSKSATEFALFVRDILQILSTFPMMGKEERRNKMIRTLVITKQIKMVYRVKKEKLIILDLFNTRQNPKRRKLE